MGSCSEFASLAELHPLIWTNWAWPTLSSCLQPNSNKIQLKSFESTDHYGEGRACQEKVWPKGALHLGQRWNKGEKEGVEGADKEASHATSCGPRPSRAPCLWLYPLLMCHHLEGTWVSCPLGAVKRTYGRTPRWMLDTLLLQATERRGFSLGILWAPILQKTVYQETTHPPTYPITSGHSSIVHHDALLLAYQFAQALL